MGQVRAEPEELRLLSRQIRDACASVDEGSRGLLQALAELGATWQDLRYVQCGEAIRSQLGRVHAAAVHLETLASKLEILAGPLEASLQAGPPAPRGALPATRAVGFRSRRREPLYWLRTGDLAPSDLDWGDAGFVAGFEADRHHGHTASDYLDLAETLPAVRKRLAAEDAPRFSPGSREARTYDAFFGGDPIRLERLPDQRLTVVDGRHRLYACMRVGVEPPVVITGAGTR